MQMTFRSVLVSLVLAVPAFAADAPTSQPIAGGALYRDIRYSDASTGPGTLLDLYVPTGATSPRPLIIWIHGGGWIEGDKAPVPAVEGAMKLGYAVASINYRLTNEAPWPAQIQDCKAALRWLRSNATRFQIDPTRVGVWGGSAGGHLAAMLGTTGDSGDPQLEGDANPGPSTRVQCVVDDFGPADLTTFLDQFAPNPIPAFLSQEPTALTKLLGGPIATKRDLAWAASPLRYVTKDDAPFLIQHGDRDPIVPLAQSQVLDGALRAAGVECQLVVIPGGSHGGAAFATPKQIQTIVDFLGRHLRPSR